MKGGTSSAVMDDANVHAVATGVSPKAPVVRKGRVRKVAGAPRAPLVAKKKKEPKPPRNPFRRSETVKLQLKKLQMSKRVETMTPRVEVIRTRLDGMQKRLDFVTGKLKLVNEELSSRKAEGGVSCGGDGDSTTMHGAIGEDLGVECVDVGSSDEEPLENVELDDEGEEGDQ